METMVVGVELPAIGQSYEVRIPRAMNTRLAAYLTAQALSSLSGGGYLPSKSSVFVWKESGALLEFSKSMEQAEVRNGSQLLLI